MQKLDLDDKVFGYWTVLHQDSNQNKGRTYWICQCVCGKQKSVAGSSLTFGVSTSCGCAGGERKSTIDASDYIGRKYGRLIVFSVAMPTVDEEGLHRTSYLCKCVCGNDVIITRHALQNENGPRSCGCWLAEQRSALGLSKRKYEPNIATARMIYKSRYSDGDLSFDDFYLLSQQNCFYCGIVPSTTYNKFIHRGEAKNSQYAMDNGHFIYNGLDRVDASKLHNIDNVVPCCEMCNAAKSDYSQEDIGKWICKVYNNWAKKYEKQ